MRGALRAAKLPRRLAKPAPERAGERAGLRVTDTPRDLVDRELAIEEQLASGLEASRLDGGVKGRARMRELALQRARARGEMPRGRRERRCPGELVADRIADLVREARARRGEVARIVDEQREQIRIAARIRRVPRGARY